MLRQENTIASVELFLRQRLAGVTFSKDEASHIMKGRSRLEYAIGTGKIRANKAKNAQNSRWSCDAADVLICAMYN